MKIPFLTKPRGEASHPARLFAVCLLLICLFSLTVGSFAGVSAQTIQYPLYTGNGIKQPTASAQPTLIYTDQWAVQIILGNDATTITRQVGMENLGQIGNLTSYYLFRATGNTARNDNLTNSLRSTAGVLWAEQQIARQQSERQPTDPLLGDQWHLENTGQSGGTSGQDSNVFAAWTAGFTGSGVQIAVVDDGLEIAHPDIAPNYFAGGSYDFNSNESNPTGTVNDGHGTSAGGVAAASDDGTECGVGVAYNAQLAGLRLIGGPSTDAMEADALGYQYQQNDIYTNSWGPSDAGDVLGKPGPLLLSAFADGVVNGRGGLGSIFVWAGGNGYYTEIPGTPPTPIFNNDNSNADGYANSRYVIAVAASDDTGVQSYYSEIGANIMVNAPSNGGSSGAGITTTDLLGANGYNPYYAGEPTDTDCTNSFGGTSSATPLVAGVIGLMLEANPSLTWRDVMHVLIETAEKNDPSATGLAEWGTNAAGYDINYFYGFGRVDAAAAVTAADTWTNVPANVTPYDSGNQVVNLAIPDGGAPSNMVTRTVNVPDNFVVEHVEVVMDVTHAYRGDIIAAVQSPNGTTSQVMFSRSGDGGDDFDQWRMSSVRHWGENSGGTWTFIVGDVETPDAGTLNAWRLIIHGYAGDGPQPTPQPTSTGGPTPQATPTELPGGATELVDNGGFDIVDSNGKPVIAPWVVSNATGDDAKCNKVGKPAIAYEGSCAFRFKGVPGEASAVKQNVDISGISFASGDTLDFLLAMNVANSSLGKIKVAVKYTDGTFPTKLSGAPVLTNGYQLYGSADDDPMVIESPNVQKIKVSMSYNTPTGKIYYDSVSLIYTPAGATALALPSADGSAGSKGLVLRSNGRQQ